MEINSNENNNQPPPPISNNQYNNQNANNILPPNIPILPGLIIGQMGHVFNPLMQRNINIDNIINIIHQVSDLFSI